MLWFRDSWSSPAPDFARPCFFGDGCVLPLSSASPFFSCYLCLQPLYQAAVLVTLEGYGRTSVHTDPAPKDTQQLAAPFEDRGGRPSHGVPSSRRVLQLALGVVAPRPASLPVGGRPYKAVPSNPAVEEE